MKGRWFIILASAILAQLVLFISLGVYQTRQTLIRFGQEAETLPLFWDIHSRRISGQGLLAVLLLLIGVVLYVRRRQNRAG